MPEEKTTRGSWPSSQLPVFLTLDFVYLETWTHDYLHPIGNGQIYMFGTRLCNKKQFCKNSSGETLQSLWPTALPLAPQGNQVPCLQTHKWLLPLDHLDKHSHHTPQNNLSHGLSNPISQATHTWTLQPILKCVPFLLCAFVLFCIFPSCLYTLFGIYILFLHSWCGAPTNLVILISELQIPIKNLYTNRDFGKNGRKIYF